jgi:hypothetical protein
LSLSMSRRAAATMSFAGREGCPAQKSKKRRENNVSEG